MLSVQDNRWERELVSSARRLAKERGVAPKRLAKLPAAEPVNSAKRQQTVQKRSVRKSVRRERKLGMWLPARTRRRTRKPQSNPRLTHDSVSKEERHWFLRIQ